MLESRKIHNPKERSQKENLDLNIRTSTFHLSERLIFVYIIYVPKFQYADWLRARQFIKVTKSEVIVLWSPERAINSCIISACWLAERLIGRTSWSNCQKNTVNKTPVYRLPLWIAVIFWLSRWGSFFTVPLTGHLKFNTRSLAFFSKRLITVRIRIWRLIKTFQQTFIMIVLTRFYVH